MSKRISIYPDPTRDLHTGHPTFECVCDRLTDAQTGICVLVAQYRTSHDFSGGLFVEVYDDSGELLDPDLADPTTPLAEALAMAVDCYREERRGCEDES